MGDFKIELKGLRFIARIGVGEQERLVGNEFIVDVSYSFPANHFVKEKLESTISYADIYDIISNKMKEKWLLLESVAKAISDDIHLKFPIINSLSVSVTKTSVPVDGMDGTATVTLES